MFISVKFSKTTHQIWSCQVTLASNSENFYFLSNSLLNFRKSYQIFWEGKELAQEQKVTGKNKLGVETPPAIIGFKLALYEKYFKRFLSCCPWTPHFDLWSDIQCQGQ